MTGQRYIDEVLLPHVRLFRGAVAFSRSKPIENVWDALGEASRWSKLSSNNKNSSSVHSREWDVLSHQPLDNVVQSMVRRGTLQITLHGGHIPY
ncbi:hypothetical protein TNCV_2332121 [Trichonephila clavipes]|nr:hypothetical protein TNCV_2332121 [Trichonephila clavipes]